VQPATSLFIIPGINDEPIFATIERTLTGGADSSTGAALAQLPSLTMVALGDPYLLEQLSALRQHFELRPQPARSLPERLRNRLAWWLLGGELRQVNTTHASLVRIIDSLIVQLDYERAARRRIEEHLASLDSNAGSNEHTLPQSMSPADRGIAGSSTQALSLVWHSSFATPTGYSSSARAFVLGLDARGVAVRPLYLYGTDRDEHIQAGQMHPRIRQLQQAPVRLDVPQVVYAPGDRFHKNSGSYRIGFTMLEVDRLPAAWVEQANQMDEIWTPTAWGADVFRSSGIHRPVVVVPLGVDTSQFKPGTTRDHLPQHTVFLSVFEWSKRKGWDILLRAYRAAFRPDDPVLLLLKIDCREPATNPLRELGDLLPEPSPPVGVLYNQTLSVAQLAELYQQSDCFVLPTHGEGWGMPVLEAMACGTPAIATHWSGPTAFLDEQNGYPLPMRSLTPTGLDKPYYQGAQWAEPDKTALVDLLRQTAANPAERQRKGAQAAQDAQQWSWQQAIERVYKRLAAI
jgi:glycosyltransferase involved in cell wall biosynthesis